MLVYKYNTVWNTQEQSLRWIYLIATKSKHDGEEILLNFRDYTIDQMGEGMYILLKFH